MVEDGETFSKMTKQIIKNMVKRMTRRTGPAQKALLAQNHQQQVY